jgi:hypothetical protein
VNRGARASVTAVGQACSESPLTEEPSTTMLTGDPRPADLASLGAFDLSRGDVPALLHEADGRRGLARRLPIGKSVQCKNRPSRLSDRIIETADEDPRPRARPRP